MRRYTGECCPLLDISTMLCTVYEHRHEPHPARPFPCLTLEQAIEARSLPDDCAYVQGLHGYSCGVDQ